jgi:hypothetical protein
MGGVTAAIITGVIWALWHAPLILLDGYDYPGHPGSGVGMMVIFTTATGVIFAWLRFRSACGHRRWRTRRSMPRHRPGGSSCHLAIRLSDRPMASLASSR